MLTSNHEYSNNLNKKNLNIINIDTQSKSEVNILPNLEKSKNIKNKSDLIICNFTDKSKRKINSIKNKNDKIISTKPTPTKIVVASAMNSLPILLQLEVDDKNFLKFYWYEILYNHEVFNLFFYFSIINPFFIRFTILFISVSLKLGVSALFFSDSYIKELNEYKNKNGGDNSDFIFVFTVQFMRILWPILITIFIKNLLNFIILIPKDLNKEMKEYFNGSPINIRNAR